MATKGSEEPCRPSCVRRVIVIPRRRSYLDTATEVSVGDRIVQDYVLPPGADPGRPYRFYGPDVQGTGRKPLPSAFGGTGINPNTPFQAGSPPDLRRE